MSVSGSLYRTFNRDKTPLCEPYYQSSRDFMKALGKIGKDRYARNQISSTALLYADRLAKTLLESGIEPSSLKITTGENRAITLTHHARNGFKMDMELSHEDRLKFTYNHPLHTPKTHQIALMPQTGIVLNDICDFIHKKTESFGQLIVESKQDPNPKTP